ncbi:MAG: GNAT family N-acetyltransferase [Lachnospiraceae bacterium]
MVYYERPGAEAVYEADYTVQSLDELDELFFRGSMNGIMGFPGASGDGAVENQGEYRRRCGKTAGIFTDEEARRWLFEGEGKLFSEEEQREKLKAYVRNRYGFYGYGFYSVLWKETGELAAWAGFQERQYQGKQVLELGYLTAPSFRRQGIASEAVGLLSEEMEDLTGEIKAFIFCHPENLASRRTAEKLCHLYPEHFQLVLEEL